MNLDYLSKTGESENPSGSGKQKGEDKKTKTEQHTSKVKYTLDC